ncbi:MAG: hypothetical protein KAT65_17870 [Methanophagales archaeon]|nr:hypothetical protein [Methanophagales archaeon]
MIDQWKSHVILNRVLEYSRGRGKEGIIREVGRIHSNDDVGASERLVTVRRIKHRVMRTEPALAKSVNG